MMTNKKQLKVLSIGNSFSVDTMEHMAEVALSLGYENVYLGNLYIGGCSIRQHYANAKSDAPAYKYYTNDGSGWLKTPDFKISHAIKSNSWDWISIQHGSKDGSRYTSVESYAELPALIEYVRALADESTRIAFNMAWVGETYHHHHELASYGGDQLLMYKNLARLTHDTVQNIKGIDRVSPTGTAVQNARTTAIADKLSRDGYHLSLGVGRYIASLTFVGSLTGADLSCAAWAPDGVDKDMQSIAVAAAKTALLHPYEITPL